MKPLDFGASHIPQRQQLSLILYALRRYGNAKRLCQAENRAHDGNRPRIGLDLPDKALIDLQPIKLEFA